MDDDDASALTRVLAEEFVVANNSRWTQNWQTQVDRLNRHWQRVLDQRIWQLELLRAGPWQPGPPVALHQGFQGPPQIVQAPPQAMQPPPQIMVPPPVQVPASADPIGIDPTDERAFAATQLRVTAGDRTATCYGCVITRHNGVTKTTTGKSAGSNSAALHAERQACLKMASDYGLNGNFQSNGAALGKALATAGIEILSLYTDFPPCKNACDSWVAALGAQAVLYSDALGAWDPAASPSKKKKWMEEHCRDCGMD